MTQSDVTITLVGSRVGDPEGPREFVDTKIDPSFDRPADFPNVDGVLQSVLDAAQPGDVIELDAGSTSSSVTIRET